MPHAVAGQPSPLNYAVEVNRVLESSDDYHTKKALGKGIIPGRNRSHDGNVVGVKNITGLDLVRGHVVQLGDHVLDAIDPSNFWLEADLAAEPLAGRLAIMLEPLPDATLGQNNAAIAGACIGLVNVTDTDHSYASALDGNQVLSSCAFGPFEILSPVDDTGEQELIIRFVSVARYGLIRGQLTSAMATSDSSKTIDNIVVMQGDDPRADSSDAAETVTVSNSLYGGAGLDNAEFVAAWDNDAEEWVFIAGKHVAQTVLTAWRVDGGTMKLQYKTRDVVVMVNGAESDWTDAHTGTETCA